MRFTSKGQVTIPIEIREALGLLPNTEVEFEIDRGAVRMKKAAAARTMDRGRRSSNTCAGAEPAASPLPDFYIGAHAALAGLALLTRDARRYRAYFPTLRISAP